MKTGRYSKDEDALLKENIEVMSLTELAELLDRSIGSIEKRIKSLKLRKGTVINDVQELEFQLESRPYYVELQSQFTESELQLFKYHWTRIIKQFSGDVLSTEEIQIVDTIKLEIMMNRNSLQQKRMMENTFAIEEMVRIEKETGMPDIANIVLLEEQMVGLSQGHGSLVKEYKELQERKERMLKAIKGDRSERVSSAVGKLNFVSLMKDLISNPELRKQLGIKMEKRRLASIEAKKRLSEYHTYVDGHIDQPVLTHETIADDNDKLFN